MWVVRRKKWSGIICALYVCRGLPRGTDVQYWRVSRCISGRWILFQTWRQRILSLTMMNLKRRLNVLPRRQPSKNWLTNEVSRELLPGRPIMWDKDNLCEMMTSGGKLNTTKSSVAKLRDICTGLDIAVDVSIKRKQGTRLRSTVQSVAAKRPSKAQR